MTTGGTPSGDLDTSFFDSLGLQGYVSASGRGTVKGSYSGTLSGLPVTIGFKVIDFQPPSVSTTQFLCVIRTLLLNTGHLVAGMSCSSRTQI